MLDKTAMDRIVRRLAEAEASLEDLHASVVRARNALESYDVEERDALPDELLAASKASYDVAHHLDRGLDLWESAVE
jgi:hypothetical protein